MKNLFFILLLLLLGFGIGYLIYNPTPTPIKELNFAKPTPTMVIVKMEQKDSEYSASFGIFTLGTARTFVAPMYHNLSTDIFIRSENPNVVVVKRKGLTWDYFFQTLPFLLNKECLTTGTGQAYCTDEFYKLEFYLNGVNDPNALDKVIAPKDKLLITYGAKNEKVLKEQLQQIPTLE